MERSPRKLLPSCLAPKCWLSHIHQLHIAQRCCAQPQPSASYLPRAHGSLQRHNYGPARQAELCCAVRFLLQDGSLEHVTRQLSGRDLQQLRTTCRDLRYSEAVLSQVETVHAMGLTWFEARVDVPYLQQLRSLSTLKLQYAESLHRLHVLSVLQLRHLQLSDPVHELDVTPLEGLISLCSLTVSSELTMRNLCHLSSLSRLSALNLASAYVAPGLCHLRSLRRLRIHCDGDWVLADAASLPQLSHVELASPAALGSSEDQEALQSMRQMPALRTLIAHDGPLMPRLLQLTQISTLFLNLDHELSDELDLSSLAALSLLGLSCTDAEGRIITAPSVTRIRLEMLGNEGCVYLPCMRACRNMQYLQILAAFPICLAAEELPPQPLSIAAQIEHGKLMYDHSVKQRCQLTSRADLQHQLPW